MRRRVSNLLSLRGQAMLSPTLFAGAVALALMCGFPVHAGTISGLFSTGVAANGTLMPGGAVDLHYQLIASADPSFPGPDAFVTSSIPFTYIPNGPNSKWIAPDANQNFGPCCAVGNYDYQTTFDLTGSPAGTMVAGEWATDNNGLDILINGTSTGNTTCLACFGSFASFSISSGFVTGTNTLDFLLSNGGGPSSLRVEFAPAVVPEPSTLALLGSGLIGLAAAFRRKLASGRPK